MKRALKILGIILLAFAIVIGGLCGLGYYAIHKLYKGSNYTETLSTDVSTEQTPETGSAPSIKSSDSVYNILLVGVDTRETTGEDNSGTVFLFSINDDKKQRSMVSFGRDIYVEIPGKDSRKLDRAYALGGGELVAAAITQNFKIQTNRYAVLKFEDIVDLVDLVGGIPITMSAADVRDANEKVNQICEGRGVDAQRHQITGEGKLICDGIQALAYTRIWDSGSDSDTQAVRQYEVLTALLNAVGQNGLKDIYSTAQKILEKVQHNIPESELWDLIMRVGSIVGYTEMQTEVPFEGMAESALVGRDQVIQPDWEKTVAELHGLLY